MASLFTTIVLTFAVCTSYAQTQAEMNKEAANAFRKADKELNEIYQKILVEYKTDTVFVKNLKQSQRFWIQFQDVELAMKYPEREKGYYGSVHQMCVAMYLTQLTEERIKTLKIWLDGIEEGDVCCGSVKWKDMEPTPPK